jgi:serine-type D-Ala-D-Ala endopeptidase (penicillin-binding protein 7)
MYKKPSLRSFAVLVLILPVLNGFSAQAQARASRHASHHPAQDTEATERAGASHNSGPPRLESRSALVIDDKGHIVFGKDVDEVRPIASITKLMTAMVVLDAKPPMDEDITISREDYDDLRHSRSRLIVGKATLPRREMLKVALMSSDNRAASALGRTTFPGGKPAFVAAMNRKAQALGMSNSHFTDPTGLQVTNVSTAADLAKMVRAASQYAPIREATTTPSAELSPHSKGGPLHYVNTNRLVKNQDDNWEIHVSKTGFINESGRCLVMEAKLPEGNYDFVLLNSPGKLSPIGDANRLRLWLENHGG